MARSCGSRLTVAMSPSATVRPGFEQHHARRQPQHLVELVAHVDDGNGEGVAQSFEIRQHFFATRQVERGERFVEQQQPGLREQRATERHALLFAAGQFVRPAAEQLAQA